MTDRELFWKAVMRGERAECPCCQRSAAINVAPLTSTHAFVLLFMARTFGYKQARHVNQALSQSPFTNFSVAGTWPKLAKWGLIERVGGRGVYRVTDKGYAFAAGKLRVPKRRRYYNDETLSWSDETVNIRDVINTDFNYDEVVRRMPREAFTDQRALLFPE